MTKPKISVVIPVWNESKYLPPCIASLAVQTFTDFEVIALYRPGTDSTLEMCRAAGWKIVRQKTPGISAARAEGFAAAKGAIIASTNGDTAVPTDWLEVISASFSDPEVAVVYGPVHFLEGRSQLFYRFMNVVSQIFFTLTHLFGRDHTIGENFAVRTSVYHSIGGFNRALPTAEDVDLGYRMASAGKVVFRPRLIAYTSNRRLARQKLRFFIHHIGNYIRLTFFGTASSDFEPIR